MDELSKQWFHTPAIVVGAGWTLEEDLKKVGHLDAHFFCTDKAFPVLKKVRVPEFVVSLNTEYVEGYGPDKWLVGGDGSKLILPVTVNPQAYKNWTGEIYWMVPANMSEEVLERVRGYGLKSEPFYRGSNSGEFAFIMTAYMTYTPVGFIGINYSWKCLTDVEPEGTDEHYVKIKGYGGSWIYTTLGWLDSRVNFLEACAQFSSEGMKIINLSAEGIMAHATALRFGDVPDFLRMIEEVGDENAKPVEEI